MGKAPTKKQLTHTKHNRKHLCFLWLRRPNIEQLCIYLYMVNSKHTSNVEYLKFFVLYLRENWICRENSRGYLLPLTFFGHFAWIHRNYFDFWALSEHIHLLLAACLHVFKTAIPIFLLFSLLCSGVFYARQWLLAEDENESFHYNSWHLQIDWSFYSVLFFFLKPIQFTFSGGQCFILVMFRGNFLEWNDWIITHRTVRMGRE